MPSDHALATLTVSQEAIAANYKLLQSKSKTNVAGVLKADGYGTGAMSAFKTLRKAGCKNFFIATPDEGEELRKIDKDAAIFMLGGLPKSSEDFVISQNIIPILGSMEEIARYKAFVKGTKIPAAIHFDTGMNRLGLGKDETEKLLGDFSLLEAFDLKLVMSHFCSSEDKDNPMNEKQAKTFAEITKHFPHTPKSICNSSGIFRDPNWHHDLLRPGISLYGGNPTPEIKNPMRSVVSLETKILQTRAVKKGEAAGYNSTHMFDKDTTTATVGVGYADGFLRSGSNRAKFYFNGEACPIRGRVSMDLIIVETGHLRGRPPQAGDMMEILGDHQSVDNLAADCGTIGYEILTSLGRRYRRVYI